MRLRTFVLGIAFAVPSIVHAASSSALVIGVDQYSAVPSLDGATNDAKDIAAALARNGASRVLLLTNHEVTKANLVNAWTTLVNDAQSGDTIFITYAGHGAQLRELNSGDERDGLDEFWVLPGFDPQNIGATWRESVFDNELRQWFSEAGKKGVKVVLVSDSCHSGGMDRAVKGRTRYVEFGNSRMLAELLSMVRGSAGTSTVISPEHSTPVPENVTMLAATAEALPVPEVVIEGQPRGALSWSFARAVEGMADRNGDGTVTRIELEDYVMSTVRMRSESLQNPVFAPVSARSADEGLFAVIHATAMASVRPAEKTSRRPMMRARELGFKPVLPLVISGTDMVPENVREAENAYAWDAETGLFRSPNGEVVAEKVTSFTVNDIVSKFILLDFLKAVAEQNPGKVIIAPQKQLYLAGEHIRFDAVRGDYQNMIVFNLANTGEVQLLDLVVDGRPQMKSPLKEMKVVEPFGSDHLVVISSSEPLEAVGRAIERGSTPKELLAALSQRIDGRDASIGILPLYTRAK